MSKDICKCAINTSQLQSFKEMNRREYSTEKLNPGAACEKKCLQICGLNKIPGFHIFLLS